MLVRRLARPVKELIADMPALTQMSQRDGLCCAARHPERVHEAAIQRSDLARSPRGPGQHLQQRLGNRVRSTQAKILAIRDIGENE